MSPDASAYVFFGMAVICAGLAFFALKSGKVISRGGESITRDDHPIVFWFVTGVLIVWGVLMALMAISALFNVPALGA